jgi:hypothetical protein
MGNECSLESTPTSLNLESLQLLDYNHLNTILTSVNIGDKGFISFLLLTVVLV